MSSPAMPAARSERQAVEPGQVRRRYLELLKSALGDRLYPRAEDAEVTLAELSRAEGLSAQVRQLLSLPAIPQEQRSLLERLSTTDNETMARFLRDNTPRAHTLVSRAALDNVEDCVATALAQGVTGDLMECGVWQGGVTILMRALLEAYADPDRQVWVADSFQGLPRPDPSVDVLDAALHTFLHAVGGLAVSLEAVQENFRRYDLLDERVRFLPGWFADTLPGAPIERLAVLRLDGDWYESTRTALECLYPRVSPGGFVIIDDYAELFGAQRAVDEYRKSHAIASPLIQVNDQVHYWRKPYPTATIISESRRA